MFTFSLVWYAVKFLIKFLIKIIKSQTDAHKTQTLNFTGKVFCENSLSIAFVGGGVVKNIFTFPAVSLLVSR